VVFDRIRENQKLQTQKFKFSDVANLSVNQVSTRSLNTSITTLTVLAFLFFFGGASTQLFVAALFVGLAIGTYSSLFLASPLLVAFRAR
jgi:preprotein translocase subunit SecF